MNYLKYVAIIIGLGIALAIFSTVKSCNEPKPTTGVQSTITVPTDTNFIPTKTETYKPTSNPFSKKTSGKRLPSNISESDVAKVTTIELKGSEHPIDIIETKSGEIYIAKDSIISSVTTTIFLPQTFRFALHYGVGATAMISNRRIRISPEGFVSFAELNISNLSFQLPIVTADLNSIGIGTQIQFYHDIYIGCVKSWNFSEGSGLALCVNYSF